MAPTGSKDDGPGPDLCAAFEHGRGVPAALAAARDKKPFLVNSETLGDVSLDLQNTSAFTFNIVNILAFGHWTFAAWGHIPFR